MKNTRQRHNDDQPSLCFLRNPWLNCMPITALGTPHGDYSRICWLPVLGPTPWLLWTSIARQLDSDQPFVVAHADVTDALGLDRRHRLDKHLNRLARSGIAIKASPDEDNQYWEIWPTTPPLPLRHHRTVAPAIREFHYRSLEALTTQQWHDLETIFGADMVRPYDDSGHEGTTP